MHLESKGIATGDASRPFVAQITIGTRNKREPLAEFAMPSLSLATQAADDWLEEYSARVGLGADRIRSMQVMQARWERMMAIEGCPPLPEPSEKYCSAIVNQVEAAHDPEGVPAVVRRAKHSARYPSAARIARTIEHVRQAGLQVSGVRVWPDGSIAVFDTRCDPLNAPGSSEDRPMSTNSSSDEIVFD